MPVVTPVNLDSPRVKQLSDQNTSGTQLGASTTDAIGFFGTTPVAQPSGNAQAAVTRGQAAGQVIAFTTTLSPVSIQAGTSTESTFRVLGTTSEGSIGGSDLVLINKPSAQAGLGVGNVRASGSNQIGVSFVNQTGTTINPTGAEQYQGVAIRGFNPLTLTASPAAVQANTSAEQLFTLTGVRSGDLVIVNKPTVQAGLEVVGYRASANNQVGITFMNVTTTTITPTASEAYTVYSLGGLDAVNNEVIIQITAAPVSIVGLGGSTEYSMPVTNLAYGDIPKGISKPSSQGGLGIMGYRISVPSTVGITFINVTGATVTPTAGEVYGIAITRANPVAPLLNYSQALTPTAVAPNSTVEQTFTVTGLIANSVVTVNKPSAQIGLGIAGVRVSAASTLAINFINQTSATITPTAAETYIIGNWQEPSQTGGTNTTTGGNAITKSAVGVIQQGATLGNAVRSALTSTGLIAGS